MNCKISPSLMCMDLISIKEQLSFLNEKADILHVDVMDGHYVKNLTLSSFFVRSIRPHTNLPIDVHFMVEKPMDFVDDMIQAGADSISIHADVLFKDAFRTIHHIKRSHVKVGVVLNPALPVSIIYPYMDLIDKVTVMTVDPGFAGQPFIVGTVSKIEELKKIKSDSHYTFEIEVDGSCNKNTYRTFISAGAEILILGSSGLFRKGMSLPESWDQMAQEMSDVLNSL